MAAGYGGEQWSCPRCTFDNSASSTSCEVCGAERPLRASPVGVEPVCVYNAEELSKCASLVAEALRIESRAADLDRAGSVAEALLHHRRASIKFLEAAASCPDKHPDKSKLDEHSTDIQLRMVYLESLGASPPTLPLDEHVGGLELTMDLSVARAPAEDISGLIAQTGASGGASAITEEGYQLVAALKSNDEMKVFIGRILESCGRRIRPGAEAELEELVPDFSGVRQVQTLASLEDVLLRAPWTELILDPSKDKLELAMDLEKEARRLDGMGLKPQAVDMYSRSIAILQFVVKHDKRMQNEKVKDMITKRLEDLQSRANQLQA